MSEGKKRVNAVRLTMTLQ